MAKKVIGFIKLQIPAGKANPAPPVGPALGQHGVNIMEFCKAFNAKTQENMGKIIPVEISKRKYQEFPKLKSRKNSIFGHHKKENSGFF